MLKDRVVAGSLAGALGTMIKAIPNLFLWKAGIVPNLYSQIAASSFIDPGDTGLPVGIGIGVVADIATGVTIGMLAAIIMKFFGRDHWIYKGITLGIMVWLWGFGVAVTMGATTLNPAQPLFQLTSLIDHIIFGVVTTYLIVRWIPDN